MVAIALLGAACGDSGDSAASADGVASEATFAPALDQGGADSAGDSISVGATDGNDIAAQVGIATQADAPAQAASDDDAGDREGGGEIVTAPVSLTPTDIGRDIVFTAQLTVAADDVAAAAQAALEAVAPLGGLLFGQQTTTEPLPRTVLTIKVLPQDFQEALSRLGGVGQLRSQNVTTDDVTERVVDLESRITTSETSVDRLRVLLEGAVGLDEVTTIERELLAREQSLEQLRGQLRTIRDAVGLATITMTIEQLLANTSVPSLTVASSFYVGDDEARGCPARQRSNIKEGDVVTACFEVTNTGGSALGDVQIVDRALGIEQAELISLTPNSTMLSGETWIFAATFEATESLDTETRVTATVADDERNTVDQGVRRTGVNTVGIESITVEQDESLPGFADSLGAGLALLGVLVGLLVIFVGLAVPFLWLAPVAGVIIWIVKRRDPNKSVAAPETTDAEKTSQDQRTAGGSTSAETKGST